MKYNLWKIKPEKKFFLTLLVLILNIISSIAQHKTMDDIEQLRRKKKHELIELALEILKEKDPSTKINSDDFEVVVLGNNQDILAEWKRKVTFIPLEIRCPGIYQYDITVSIITKCISRTYSSGIKSSNYLSQDLSFMLTNEDDKVIEMAKQEYNRSNEKGQFYILEKENVYEIIHITDFFRSSQLIEKGTLNKRELTHKEKIQQSESQNYFEIK